MTAVLFRHRTAELDAWLADRHARGADRYDEVWKGVYVVNPLPRLGHQQVVDAFTQAVRAQAEGRGSIVVPGVNVGHRDDFRGPDVALLPAGSDPEQSFFPAIPMAVEVRSPDEDPEEKLPFYLERVREAVLLDRQLRTVRWLAARDGEWHDVERSEVLDVDVATVVEHLRWPA